MTNGADNNGFLELSFEYLVAKDTLKWITITSDQVQLIQSTVELVIYGHRVIRPPFICDHNLKHQDSLFN